MRETRSVQKEIPFLSLQQGSEEEKEEEASLARREKERERDGEGRRRRKDMQAAIDERVHRHTTQTPATGACVCACVCACVYALVHVSVCE